MNLDIILSLFIPPLAIGASVFAIIIICITVYAYRVYKCGDTAINALLEMELERMRQRRKQ
jgi:uncharacterized membrane protein YqaE (UPF0057 family)